MTRFAGAAAANRRAGGRLRREPRRSGPVFPDVTPEQLRESLGGPLPDDPVEPARRWSTSSRQRAEPGVVATGQRALLRLRDRRRAAGGARRRLAHLDLGPERRPLRRRRRRRSVVEQVARRLARRAARPAGATSSIGFVTGTPDGARDRARGRARTTCSTRSGWDVERDGLPGAPRDPRRSSARSGT